MSLTSYRAQDRLRALASGQIPPSRSSGDVTLADISGFMARTEIVERVSAGDRAPKN